MDEYGAPGTANWLSANEKAPLCRPLQSPYQPYRQPLGIVLRLKQVRQRKETSQALSKAPAAYSFVRWRLKLPIVSFWLSIMMDLLKLWPRSSGETGCSHTRLAHWEPLSGWGGTLHPGRLAQATVGTPVLQTSQWPPRLSAPSRPESPERQSSRERWLWGQ